MSSLLEGIDTTHVGEKKPGGGGADSSGEGKSNALKLVFAVVAVIAGVGVIVWQLVGGGATRNASTPEAKQHASEIAKDFEQAKAKRPSGPNAQPTVYDVPKGSVEFKPN
jgi:hypothetical protein